MKQKEIRLKLLSEPREELVKNIYTIGKNSGLNIKDLVFLLEDILEEAIKIKQNLGIFDET